VERQVNPCALALDDRLALMTASAERQLNPATWMELADEILGQRRPWAAAKPTTETAGCD
jgi:hypothetical protein